MEAAEVVVGKVEGEGGPQVFPLFRESAGQPGHPLHVGADGEVVPLDVAGADPGFIGRAVNGAELPAGGPSERLEVVVVGMLAG